VDGFQQRYYTGQRAAEDTNDAVKVALYIRSVDHMFGSAKSDHQRRAIDRVEIGSRDHPWFAWMVTGKVEAVSEHGFAPLVASGVQKLEREQCFVGRVQQRLAIDDKPVDLL